MVGALDSGPAEVTIATVTSYAFIDPLLYYVDVL